MPDVGTAIYRARIEDTISGSGRRCGPPEAWQAPAMIADRAPDIALLDVGLVRWKRVLPLPSGWSR